MRNQLSLDEDENDSSASAFYWWRLANDFDDIKLDPLNLFNLKPRIRVLREMERLAMVASEGLDELRHKLHSYRSGDLWVPTGGIKKEDMDIPPIVTILMVGFCGSGKSSLVNLMYSVLGRSGLIPFAQTSENSSNHPTMFMEEHNILRSMRSGFCVYDSRGLDYDHVEEGLEEVTQWMTDGVHHNQLCVRSGEESFMEDDAEIVASMRSSSKFMKRRVNCAMVVANVAEIYRALKAGDWKPLEATKELFLSPALRRCNENPILILTHGETLSTEQRINGRLKICEFLGISETSGVYDIACLTEYGILAEESDRVTAYSLTEAIYRGLLIADRSHLPKERIQDWLMLLLSLLMRFLSLLFEFLAQLFSKLGERVK